MSKAPSSSGLEGKRIWVIGGCGYLGRPAVECFALEGAQVLCVDHPAVVEKAPVCAGAVHFCGFDFSAIDHIASWCQTMAHQHGVPDALVHLATFSSRGKTFEELDQRDLEGTFQFALTGGFLLTRSVADLMVAQGGGSIVLFSSMYGLVSPDASLYIDGHLKPNPIDYGIAKAGIIQMTKYCAMQYGQKGVRVNCIAPGPFPNPAVQAADAPFIERLAGRTLLRRIGQASEMTGPIRFLVSSDSSYMTGQCLVIDGGWTAW